ncbi:MAG: hypothetical protein D6818_03540 [Bacteroidetes bacterium]|nr:MAG: hypothetical protein D6818_03540 [Bacteroidota bacterium]
MQFSGKMHMPMQEEAPKKRRGSAPTNAAGAVEVGIADFDGSLQLQERLKGAASVIIGLNDLEGTTYFCTPEAQRALDRRLRRHHARLWFLGSGNYHYTSYLLMRRIRRPFTLVLFDHHSDAHLQPTLLSCGSWVAEALLHLPRLKRVVLVGVQERYLEGIPQALIDKIVWLPPKDWTAERLLAAIPTRAVYVSIDKDVLDPRWALTNWDQGQMPLPLLLELLRALAREKQIIGADVCGELPPAQQGWFGREVREAVARNEQANLAILQALIDGSGA